MIWDARRGGAQQQAEDARGPWDMDYSRIIHSASFRRLQGKTQILNLGDGDFYRTRLTHSLEVAQVAGGIARQFRRNYADHAASASIPEDSLIQAIGFTHDLGHPPFGHGGEVALNYCAREYGGFEGNGQTLRILSRLERMSDVYGANLTRRTMLGVLKYPAPFSALRNEVLIPKIQETSSVVRLLDRKSSKPPKCYLDSEQEIVDWILHPLEKSDREEFQSFLSSSGKHAKTKHKSFDCSIMDVADDIAYGVHDLEDSIALSLLNESQFKKCVDESLCREFLDNLSAEDKAELKNDSYESFVEMLFSGGSARKKYIGRLVHYFITGAIIEEIEVFKEPLLRFRAVLPKTHRALVDALQEVVREAVILSPRVQHLEFRGQNMVVTVYEVLSSGPKAFLPSDSYKQYIECGNDRRAICDYVAGMTDDFLLKTYDRLFSPRMGSVFDKL
jgi:dGTPase